MSEVLKKKLTVAQVCGRLPGARGAERVSPATVTRWILTGCPSRRGERVRLRATRVGSRWLIDPDDLDAFFKALGEDPPAATATIVPPVTPGPTNAQRRTHDAAVKKLDRQLGPKSRNDSTQ